MTASNPVALHTHTFDGLEVQTGDVLCTVNGAPGSMAGAFWRGVGALVPGQIDHCALYVGPGGRCVEAGVHGVIVFEMPGTAWDAGALHETRGVLDRLYGVAVPALRGHAAVSEEAVRRGVADFCLDAAERHVQYNVNFFAADDDARFYCSQLIYRAYREHGIDLNTDDGVLGGPLLGRIVFPEEIWNTCPHRVSPAFASPPRS
ncbi:MAG: hypothetical protein MUF00_11210 [Gemmatimonadaceae bacterium]|jgi:hypothetical protein|nr:hypothetical protein [Gemmatimonadaceae bacterium]